MKFDLSNNQSNINLELLLNIPTESKKFLNENPDLFQADDLGLINNQYDKTFSHYDLN